MAAAVAITRLDLTAGELRRAARKEKNGTVARRILAACSGGLGPQEGSRELRDGSPDPAGLDAPL